jgi:hypothetical protein
MKFRSRFSPAASARAKAQSRQWHAWWLSPSIPTAYAPRPLSGPGSRLSPLSDEQRGAPEREPDMTNDLGHSFDRAVSGSQDEGRSECVR